MPRRKSLQSVSKHPYCIEYAKLFLCAARKGMIKRHSGSWGIEHPTNVRFISPSYTGPNIPKPKHFCRELAKDAHTAHFLGILRTHSGCAPRPSGSSSRFAPSPGKCYQPQCSEAPCPEICYDDQGNVIDNSSARRELKDFGTEVTDFLKGPKGIITIVALVVFFVLTKKI